MEITIYQVDAFTDKLFGGNPAAVCPLEDWLPDETMQQIALENNLSETAFVVSDGKKYTIRWFTPLVEVDLCGHATLAAAHVYFSELKIPTKKIVFQSKSGPLTVTKKKTVYKMDFPKDDLQLIDTPLAIKSALACQPIATYQGKSDYLVILPTQQAVEELQPDFALLSTLPVRGVIVSAQGTKVDMVSRFFAPQCGIDEDPVTGSAHTSLTPFWAKQLKKNKLSALQLSKRGGVLNCALKGDRVAISGNAITYLKGVVNI